MADVLAGNLIVGIKAQLGDFKKQMDDASKKVAGLKDSMEKARSGINTAGLAIAGAGATVGVAMLAMVKSTATFGDNLNKMSLKTGESTKTLSGLAFAAGRAGTDIGTVEKGIKRAAANMYDASQGIGEAKGAFDELGISATNTDGTLRKGSELLFEFADKTKGMTDATKKAALAQDIFGRAGVDLLPLFADGAEGMHSLMEEADRLGVVMDDTTAAMGADAVDAQLNFTSSVRGVVTSLSTSLLPILTTVMNAMAGMMMMLGDWLKNNQSIIQSVAGNVGKFIMSIIDGWIEIIGVVDDVFDVIIGIVTRSMSAVYEKIRWVLSKIGVDLPDLTDMFASMGDTGESAADKVREKWGKFKNSFKVDMKDNQTAHATMIKAVDTSEVQLAEKRAVRIEQDKQASERAKTFKEKRFRESIADMLEVEDDGNEKRLASSVDIFAEINDSYGEMLTDQQLENAQMLKLQGDDWEAYIKEVTAPTVWEEFHKDIKESFLATTEAMATAFNTSALSGDFSLAFKEFGNGFKNSVVGMAADLMTELQKGFLKKLAMSVIDAFSGGGGGLSQIIGGIGSSLSGGLGGVVGGVGGALGSVGGLLGSAGGALAGGASAVGGAAMGAIGAIGASTLGIGLLVGGAALAIHEMTGGKKSEGTKIRDMIRRADNPAERLAGFLAIENDLANASIASTIMGTARMWSQKKTWGDGSPVRQEQAEKRAYDDAVRELSSARHGNLPNDVITRGAETARRAVEMFFALSEAESSELMAFQKGGIIPGILGSPRLIIGHAGEEVVTRQDPRHSINFGSGLTVYITGNYINSDIDIKMLARRAGEGIMKELKVMQLVATS